MPDSSGQDWAQHRPHAMSTRDTSMHTHARSSVLAHPTPVQNKVRELEERCRAQSEQFCLLSRDLEQFRQQAGRVDLLASSPTPPSTPFLPFMNGLATSRGAGRCWWQQARAAPSVEEIDGIGSAQGSEARFPVGELVRGARAYAWGPSVQVIHRHPLGKDTGT